MRPLAPWRPPADATTAPRSGACGRADQSRRRALSEVRPPPARWKPPSRDTASSFPRLVSTASCAVLLMTPRGPIYGDCWQRGGAKPVHYRPPQRRAQALPQSQTLLGPSDVGRARSSGRVTQPRSPSDARVPPAGRARRAAPCIRGARGTLFLHQEPGQSKPSQTQKYILPRCPGNVTAVSLLILEAVQSESNVPSARSYQSKLGMRSNITRGRPKV